MNFYYRVNESSVRMVTAIGYNPLKHAIVTGSEEGLVKFWEVETGIFMSQNLAHQGWVKGIVYWKSPRVMMSAGLDCTIVLWKGEVVISRIYMGDAIHSISIVGIRQSLLMTGMSNGTIINLPLPSDCVTVSNTSVAGNDLIDLDKEEKMCGIHTDVVSGIWFCSDSKVASVGFDRRLVIYDLQGGSRLRVATVVEEAHEAAISCISGYTDPDGYTWFVTGSFDKHVKVWNCNGKLVTRVDDFSSPIIDLCIIDKSGLMWVSNGGYLPWILDVRSGENMTPFASSFRAIESESFRVHLLRYFPEVAMIVGSTTRRHLLTWRSKPNSTVSRLVCGQSVDCITYSHKSPILLICSIGNGQLIQWENRESNDGAYTVENTNMKQSMQFSVNKKLNSRQFQLDQAYSRHRASQEKEAKKNKKGSRFIQMIYVDEKDILIAAAEDGIIYIFGYDVAAMKALVEAANKKITESQWKKTRFQLLEKKQSNLSSDKLSKTVDQVMGKVEVISDIDPITMRVTGLSCHCALLEHRNVVTGIATVPPGHSRTNWYLLSCSWDQTILVWNLTTYDLVAKFNVKSSAETESESEDVLTNIVYSPELDQFAYSSGDYVFHIRQFSLVGAKMNLISQISEHEGEITRIDWTSSLMSWITSSEDHSIRIWDCKTLNCTQLINAEGSIIDMFYEPINQCIVAAVGHRIKVFDTVEERICQVNEGHEGDVINLLAIPERNQFLSTAEDGQILLWSMWRRPKKYVAQEVG